MQSDMIENPYVWNMIYFLLAMVNWLILCEREIWLIRKIQLLSYGIAEKRIIFLRDSSSILKKRKQMQIKFSISWPLGQEMVNVPIVSTLQPSH